MTRDPQHSPGRTVAATLGTLPVAIALGIVAARVLPLGQSARFAVGLYGVMPVWVALVCVVFQARSARRAWAGLAIGYAGLAIALWSVA